jgi:TusA-related sulfurtransferase/predicted peroxiredoxin
MGTINADSVLELPHRTITTSVAYDARCELQNLARGQVLEVVTDDFEPFESDIPAWCEESGHRLLDRERRAGRLHFLIEKGDEGPPGTSLAMVISDPGLLELLSPLAFALAAALEGVEAHLYFQGPAVRVLARGFRARLRGWQRPFTRFAQRGMTDAGHIPAQDKLSQLRNLNAQLYACGGSMQHYKVAKEDFVFDDVRIVEYLTFMSVMKSSDIQLLV